MKKMTAFRIGRLLTLTVAAQVIALTGALAQAGGAASDWVGSLEDLPARARLLAATTGVGQLDQVRVGLEIELQPPGFKTYWRGVGQSHHGLIDNQLGLDQPCLQVEPLELARAQQHDGIEPPAIETRQQCPQQIMHAVLADGHFAPVGKTRYQTSVAGFRRQLPFQSRTSPHRPQRFQAEPFGRAGRVASAGGLSRGASASLETSSQRTDTTATDLTCQHRFTCW